MPRIKPRVKKSELIRTKIYYCAIERFCEHGFSNTKISDICEAAGVSTGTFYYYFPSKEAVFLEYARVADDMVNEWLSTLVCDSCAQRLKELVKYKIHMFSVVGHGLSNTCLMAFLKHQDDSFMDINRSVYVHFMNTIEEGIQAGEFSPQIDPYVATGHLRYIVCGLALHWTSSKEAFDIDAEVEKLVDQFIAGLKI